MIVFFNLLIMALIGYGLQRLFQLCLLGWLNLVTLSFAIPQQVVKFLLINFENSYDLDVSQLLENEG